MSEIECVKTSAENKDLFTALVKAQAAIHHASKDSTNPAFRSTYASLESVLDACKPHLNSNGIYLVQIPGADGRKVWVDTRLTHETGQFIEGRLTLMAKDEMAHAVGSAITYARRYSLAAFMGMGQEDDDGNSNSSPKSTKTNPPPKDDKAPKDESAKKELRERLGKLMEEKGWTAEQVQTLMMKVFGVKASVMLKVEDLKLLVDTIEKKTYKEAMGQSL